MPPAIPRMPSLPVKWSPSSAPVSVRPFRRASSWMPPDPLPLLSTPGSVGVTPSISAVAHAASYSQDAVAPGEVVAIFGSGLGPPIPAGLQLDASGSVATTLADTRVLFDGVASPMIFSSAGQIDAVVP